MDGIPRTSRNQAWPQDRIDHFKELWADHGVTIKQIGAELGITRGAICGKAFRLGLPKRRIEVYAPRSKKIKIKSQVRNRLVQRVRKPPSLAPEAPLNAPFRGISLLDLKRGECRFPRGERVPYLFCGEPVQEGSSYCPHCHDLTHNTAVERQTRRVVGTKFAFGGQAA